jgi:phosphatidylglycerophosphatase A
MLWIAQGFGVGRLPVAPGTFGTLVGVLWTVFLLATQNLWVFSAGCAMGLAASVWLCGEAERIMHMTDPGSVVLDEIVAMPVCFAGWLALDWLRTGHMLKPDDLFLGGGWLVTLSLFAAFRFFDVLKPWPVRQSQSLPAGWGVTADDLLAAAYVNLVVTPVLGWFLLRSGPG